MAFSIRNKKPPKVFVLVDMVEDIIYNRTEGSQFLGIFIADLDPEFFFDGHKGLQDVERVQTEVIVQGCVWGQIGLVDTQFFVKNCLHFSRNGRLVDKRVHNQ